MHTLKPLFAVSLMIGMMALTACDHPKKNETDSAQATEQHTAAVEKAEVLPYLNMQEAKADYALPFCEKKNCIEIDIQTLTTQEKWLNEWITQAQTSMIQDQIGLKQKMTLQQAIDAYIKKSDTWVDEFATNQPYELNITTRIAAQRNQYLLLQLALFNRSNKSV